MQMSVVLYVGVRVHVNVTHASMFCVGKCVRGSLRAAGLAPKAMTKRSNSMSHINCFDLFFPFRLMARWQRGTFYSTGKSAQVCRNARKWQARKLTIVRICPLWQGVPNFSARSPRNKGPEPGDPHYPQRWLKHNALIVISMTTTQKNRTAWQLWYDFTFYNNLQKDEIHLCVTYE